MKKILALVLALVMVLAMGAVAFATGGGVDDPATPDTPDTPAATPTTYSITISKDTSDKAAHTYGAYQLFKGDLAEEGEGSSKTKTLSNIQWGDNIDTTKVATLIGDINTALGLTGEAALASTADAATVAKAISDKELAKDSTEAKAIAEAFSKAITGAAKGTVTVAADATEAGVISGLAAGYYMVKDDADVTAEGVKTRYILEVVSNVEVKEKGSVSKVEKKVLTEDGAAQDAADYDIGDKVPYTITGTLPSNFTDYKTFKTFTITDTLSNGLTPPAADKVKINLTDKNGADLTSLFDVAVSGQKLTISLKNGIDLRAVEEPVFANNDKIFVSYEAVLNENAKIGSEGNDNTVKLEFSNNPNSDGDGDKGTTPEDKVVVFTYQINALKVEPDGDGITEEQYNALEAGKENYVKIGDKYFQTKALDGAGFTLFKKEGTTETQVGEEITGVTTFEFKGTDAGTYVLKETTVPAGYNKCDDIEITITATYDTESDDPKLKSLTVSPDSFTITTTTNNNGTVDDTTDDSITTNGIAEGKIVNQKGSQLPSTGGVGTTIFYVAGSILVLAAVILLVTKRRMNAGE